MSDIILKQNETRERIYTASAGQTDFAVPFWYESAGQMGVTVVDGDGNAIEPSFTMLPAGKYGTENQPGILRLDAPLEGGERVEVYGKTPFGRVTSLSANSGTPSAKLNEEYSNLQMQLQELGRRASRSLLARRGEAIPGLPASAAMRGNLLWLNPAGTGWEMMPAGNISALAADLALGADSATRAVNNSLDAIEEIRDIQVQIEAIAPFISELALLAGMNLAELAEIASGLAAKVSVDGGDSSQTFVTSDGGTPRTLAERFSDRLTVRDWGAVGDGLADDTAAFQAAAAMAGGAGSGELLVPSGFYRLTAPVLIPSNVKVVGAGRGVAIISHPGSHAFKNSDTTAGNTDISISGITFDAGGTSDGGVSMTGVTGLSVSDCHFRNIKPVGVTVGIGISCSATANSGRIKIQNCSFDCPDYGVVIDGGASGGKVRGVIIAGCTFAINWGSGISIARDVRQVALIGNDIDLLADTPDLYENSGVGVGIKIWQGGSAATGPADIAVLGNTILGSDLRAGDGISGISANNHTNNLTVIGNTFRKCTRSFFNNFTFAGGNNFIFANNTVTDCDDGFYNDNSSDVEPIIVGNTFRDIARHAIRTSANHAIINNNKIKNVGGKAIYLNSPAEAGTIAANVIQNVGEEAVFMAGSGASNELMSITGNTIEDCSLSEDGGFAVIQLNDQSHLVVGNIIRNSSTSVKPSWIIGSGAGNHRLIANNWMFGARLGYRQVTGANDLYTNIERGGIG